MGKDVNFFTCLNYKMIIFMANKTILKRSNDRNVDLSNAWMTN